jgi:hypothetical protein
MHYYGNLSRLNFLYFLKLFLGVRKPELKESQFRAYFGVSKFLTYCF